jgi:predicted histidine transporter YuiF (NhaC family)
MAMSAIGQLKTGFGSLSKSMISYIASANGVTLAQEKLTWAELKAAVAAKGLGKAMWASLGPYALVAAAIAVVIGGLIALSAAYNKQEKDAAQAAETAKRLQSAYRETAEEYENLKNTVEEY